MKHGNPDRWEAAEVAQRGSQGVYDPSLDLLYWGVGNPSGDYSGDKTGPEITSTQIAQSHCMPARENLHGIFNLLPMMNMIGIRLKHQS